MFSFLKPVPIKSMLIVDYSLNPFAARNHLDWDSSKGQTLIHVCAMRSLGMVRPCGYGVLKSEHHVIWADSPCAWIWVYVQEVYISDVR
jgi:hypothetical protein